MDVDTNTKQNFYARFQESISALETQIESLPSIGPTERPGAVNHCLAAISALSDVVKDASSFLPAYDQRSYSEQLKAISEKLSETRRALAPRQKFSFKNRRKEPAATIGGAIKISSSSSASTATYGHSAQPDDRGTAKVDNVVISARENMHVRNDPPAAPSSLTSSLLLSDIKSSVVVFPALSTLFSSAAVKGVTKSLLYLGGAINGPIHLTSVTDSTVVVACRQFRMHDAKNVDVYLLCSSRPIIEDCSGIRFAPLGCEIGGEWENVQNLWDQVDDFKWLKSEHSPNWAVIPEGQRVPRRMWEEVRDKRVVDGSVGEDLASLVRGYRSP